MKFFSLSALTFAAALGEGTIKYSNSSASDGNGSLAYSPPVYPGVQGGRTQDQEWQEAYARAREFVKQLTVAEKVNITNGVGWENGLCVGNTGDLPRFNFRGLCLQDGPLGVRFADLIDAFPAGISAGSTFNKKLIYDRGEQIGLQHKAKGVDIALGPAVGPLGVKAQGGRIWEAFGADPYLQGVAAAETVKGIQDQGVMANGKHYLMNEQEIDRNTISSNVNDRALHELYAWPFADMVHAGLGSVMCSYNLINNSYGCENSKLLNGVLKDEMGFQGFVMSDWEALRSGVLSAISGADMNMPGGNLAIPIGTSQWGWNMTKAIVNGTMPLDRLDDMATRIMAAYYKVGVDEARKSHEGPNFSSWTKLDYGIQYPLVGYGDVVRVNQHIDARTRQSRDISQRVATEAVVLLRNQNTTLPLDEQKPPKRVSIVGLAAAPSPDGPNNAPDQGASTGALGGGWGSGQVWFSEFVTPFEELNRRFLAGGSAVNYNFDVDVTSNLLEAVQASDMNIVFGLADSGEGYINFDGNEGDRKNASLWHNADAIIKTALNSSRNNIIVVSSVGPVNLETFINHPNCSAVLFTTPGGEYAGRAIADVVFGKYNPSGRLPFTIAKDDSDYIGIINTTNYASNGFPQDDTFIEHDLYVDYRHFDHKGIEPRFPFGFGMSYTNFTFQNLVLQPVAPPKQTLPTPAKLSEVYDFGDKVPTAEEMLFPKDEITDRVPGFLYPYLNKTSEGEPTGTYPYPKGYSTKQPELASPAGGFSGGNKALWDIAYRAVSTVTNSGNYDGAYVAQIYIEYPKSEKYPTPPKQLRGFEKQFLYKGQPGQLQFDILTRDLSVWDVETQQWVIPRGEYTVHLCHDSRNCPLKQSFTLN